MKYVFHCETGDGKPAHVLVTDLNEFVQAPREASVAVADMDGNQSLVLKGDLTVLSVSYG